MPCCQTKTPEADVTGLQEGKKYKFRVKAVNKEGESEPLEADQYIIAKNPHGKKLLPIFINGSPCANLSLEDSNSWMSLTFIFLLLNSLYTQYNKKFNVNPLLYLSITIIFHKIHPASLVNLRPPIGIRTLWTWSGPNPRMMEALLSLNTSSRRKTE